MHILKSTNNILENLNIKIISKQIDTLYSFIEVLLFKQEHVINLQIQTLQQKNVLKLLQNKFNEYSRLKFDKLNTILMFLKCRLYS